MSNATVRIPAEKKDILKTISWIEKRGIKEILTEMIDEYIERHKETLELLSRPEWVEAIMKGREDVEKGIKGKSIEELAD